VNRTFLALCAAAMLPAARASITVPGANGSDGALTVPADANTTIDLSQAPTGVWDQNNAANAGKGVYDPDKWAVVFKYSSVTIPSGVTVNFTNNASRAPVVWLVNGDVTINGTINLWPKLPDGSHPGEPGPGGFRGGYAAQTSYTGGFGPGGGTAYGYGAYATTLGGANDGLTYGNASIVPLLGGSGGGGFRSPSGGGGAILIAATGSVTVNGSISADAISPYNGTGGAIRIIASSVLGNGSLSAYSPSANGRIRIETPSLDTGLHTQPAAFPAPPDNPARLWPGASDPSTRIVSVAAAPAPANPVAAWDYSAADVRISSPAAQTVTIETKNIPTDSTVSVRVTPQLADSFIAPATLATGNASTATWTAQVTVPFGLAAMQVRVEPKG
jgi:hypothetical protein